MTDRQAPSIRTRWRFLRPASWLGLISRVVRNADARLFGIEYSQYHRILRKLVLADGCTSLLDVGCGERSPVALFAADIPYRVGVDAHLPSIEKSRAARIHSDYVVANVLDIGKRFPPDSFDCVTLLEVIEHLPRSEGQALLEQCERIARKRVVLSTPNGFVEQPAVPGNPLQAHVSGWTVADFRNRGYEVTGIAGWKVLRGPLMRPRWRPHALLGRIALLTEPWVEARPELAFQLLCVKETAGK